MEDLEVKQVQLRRNEILGFGFSIVGGSGLEFPPVIYDIIEGSPAANSGKLEAGDVIVEVNQENVITFTTKEVLKCLRLSSDTVKLKLRKDPEIKQRVQEYISNCPSPCRNNARKGIHQQENMTDERIKDGKYDNNSSNGIDKTLGNKVDGNEENIPPFNGSCKDEPGDGSKSPKSKSTPRFEAFMMTGDLIINLDKESSGRGIIPPSFKKIDSLKASSTPSSPGDRVSKTERLNQRISKDDNPMNSSFGFSSIVRTSKSEDHLQKALLTTVNIDIEDGGLASSSSINNLMSSQPENDRIVWTYNDPTSSPKTSPESGSTASTHSPCSSYTASPTSPQHKQFPNDQCFDSDTSKWSFHSASKTTNGMSMNESEEIMTANCHINASGEEQTEVMLSFSSKATNVNVDTNKVYVHVEENSETKNHRYHKTRRKEDSQTTDSDETSDDLPYEKLDDETSVSSNGSGSNEGSHRLSPPSQTDEEVSDIESLHSYHYSPKAVDMPSASRLAKRLYLLDGFKKSDVSRHLSKNNEFARVVAEEYLSYFDFTGDSLDEALRKFLNQFALTGETQERERVLVHYSKRYLDCNPNIINSQDAVHTLTCALMLLNTDLHGENVPRKMTCPEFIENLSGLNEGEDYPRDMLRKLYHSIKTQPLEWAIDDDNSINLNANSSNQNKKEMGSSFNPFIQVPNATDAKEYKKGYVMKKSCIDANGKKTPLGKRGWRMYHATLRDMVLYLHKDEQGFKTSQLYDNLHNSIRIHHCVAIRATDYKKKQHVFRLHTADLAQYLFQTCDSRELQSWIDSINFVAAKLSAPPLPGGVGSSKRFQRPLMPVSHTQLNLREQLQSHGQKVTEFENELDEHRKYPPEKSAKSRIVQDYHEKLSYLQFELNRYKTYIYSLLSQISKYPEIDTPLVETSIKEHDEPSDKSVTESKTSPSKQQSPVISKVSSEKSTNEAKDNSHKTDRYSYRAAIYTNLEENYV